MIFTGAGTPKGTEIVTGAGTPKGTELGGDIHRSRYTEGYRNWGDIHSSRYTEGYLKTVVSEYTAFIQNL